MKITEIKIRKLTNDDKLKAIVSVTLDGVFAVHDIKVINGHQGLFIAMPSRKTNDGTYRDIVHPIHPDFRSELSDQVLRIYNEALMQQNDDSVSSVQNAI